MTHFVLPETIVPAQLGSLDKYQAFPVGEKVAVVVTKSEARQMGEGLVLVFTVKGIEQGPHYGKEGEILNSYLSEDEKKKLAGRKDIARLAMCCGMPSGVGVSNLEKIANKPFRVDVEPQRDQESGEPHPFFTRITTLYNINGAQPYASQSGQTASQAVAPVQQTAPPVAVAAPAVEGWDSAPVAVAPTPAAAPPAEDWGTPTTPGAAAAVDRW